MQLLTVVNCCPYQSVKNYQQLAACNCIPTKATDDKKINRSEITVTIKHFMYNCSYTHNLIRLNYQIGTLKLPTGLKQ